MDYLIDLWDWLNINKDVLVSIGSIATAVTAGVLVYTLAINRRQLKSQEQELAVANYKTIFQQFDSPTAKHARRVIYHSFIHIGKLVENYKQKDDDGTLDSVNEIARYVAGIYDSVYFLVIDNKKLENKLLRHHGFTIARLWIILQGLHQTWINEEHVGEYVGFKKLGTDAYCYGKNKKNVDEYIEKNYKIAMLLDGREIMNLKKRILGIDFEE